MKFLKITLLAFFTFLIFHQSSAQVRALTENGDEVVLLNDGTWHFIDESKTLDRNNISFNPHPFIKDSGATFLVKSTKNNVGIYVTPKLWNFKKGTSNQSAEFEFEYEGGDLYGIMINEKIEIPLDGLYTIAINNAKKAAPDAKLIFEEFREVNGKKVMVLKMTGTVQGIKFSYFGYYFSSPNGTTQLLTFSTESLMEEKKDECEKFLNGIVVFDN